VGVTERRFFTRAHARRFSLAERLYAGPTPPGLSRMASAWALTASAHGALRGAAAVRLDRPVLSVGGLGVGGSGKTPVARWVARTLAERGRRVAVLTRGYGWTTRTAAPLVLLPDAGGRRAATAPDRQAVAPGPAEPRARAARSGGPGWSAAPDEARLFIRDGCAVGAHPRRAAAAAALARAGVEPAAFLLDDGFQHRQLRRDWDLVVLSARELAAPRRTLPAGPFRESWSALARADRVAITGLDAEQAAALGRNGIPGGRSLCGAPVLAGTDWVGLIGLDAWLAGERPVASTSWSGPLVGFSGIADPAAFERLLAARRLDVSLHVVFPDHHRFTSAERERLLALRPPGGALVTTEKDAARLPAGWGPAGGVLVAVTELRIWRGEAELVDDLERLVPAER
jgi:tetraacyldisaccharide 4'-kinase